MEEKMFISKVVNLCKWCWLYITRISRCIFKHFGTKLSILFVVFSFTISMFFMVPSLFSRVPVFSYLIDTLSLPLSYELEGTILLVDAADKPLNQVVTIYVGGYSIDVSSGEPFIMEFASENTDYFYITVEYVDENGEETTITKKIETNDKTTIKKVIKIYV